MQTRVTLSFAVEPLNHAPDVLTITPVLNGTPLTELVGSFEREHGFQPAGAYGGLVPAWVGSPPTSPPPGYGSLEHCFIGKGERGHPEGQYVLDCDCGNSGCWPLSARIIVTNDTVVWDAFKQPHRPSWDYSGFGPFVFEAEQYRTAVAQTAAANPDLRFAWEDD